MASAEKCLEAEEVEFKIESPQIEKKLISDMPAKIDVLLKPVGDAPIMKQKKWAVEGSKTIAWIQIFLYKALKLGPGETVFIYVQQSFAPNPQQTIANLFSCFGADNKLVLHYSKTQAWG